MAKTRLNGNHRDLLRRFAMENVRCEAERKAFDRAYAKAAKLVRDAVEKKYPTDEMAVLAKHNVAKPDTCIRGASADGRVIPFNFKSSEDAPVCPQTYCSTRAIPFSQATVDAVLAYDRAKIALDKAEEDKKGKYLSLIRSATTFEEVVDIWPAAETLRERICAPSTAVIALSDDVRAFIRRDNAGAQMEAA